jgi:hypothetical protein
MPWTSAASGYAPLGQGPLTGGKQNPYSVVRDAVVVKFCVRLALKLAKVWLDGMKASLPSEGVSV